MDEIPGYQTSHSHVAPPEKPRRNQPEEDEWFCRDEEDEQNRGHLRKERLHHLLNDLAAPYFNPEDPYDQSGVYPTLRDQIPTSQRFDQLPYDSRQRQRTTYDHERSHGYRPEFDPDAQKYHSSQKNEGRHTRRYRRHNYPN